MLVISGASNPDLAEKIAYYLKCQFVKANTEMFLDLELRVCIDVPVKGEGNTIGAVHDKTSK